MDRGRLGSVDVTTLRWFQLVADGVLYKVVSNDGSCDDTELSYTISVTGKDAAELCLAWEVRAGDCVKINGINDPDEKVACSPATDGSTVALPTERLLARL